MKELKKMRVGNWTVTPALNLLERDGRSLKLEPRAMDLLVLFADRAGEIIAPDEIFERVWRGRVVEDSALYKRVNQLRKVLGDDARAPSFIETVSKRGYRLIAPVAVLEPAHAGAQRLNNAVPERHARFGSDRVGRLTMLGSVITGLLIIAVAAISLTAMLSDDTVPPAIERSADAVGDVREPHLASPGDRSIAVLPFEDLSQSGDQEYFSDGLSEELIKLLAQVPGLRVTARTSAFSFKGSNATIKDIATRLDVAHILEGSVRRADDELRITAKLIDTQSDALIWYQTYDRPAEDIFAIQEEIAARVVDELRIELRGSGPTVEETTTAAYALYLQARHIYMASIVESLPVARDLLERVIELDPNYLPARYQLAWTYTFIAEDARVFRRSEPSYEQAMAQAHAVMESAAALAPDRPEVNAWRGWVAGLNHDMETAATYLERALSQRLDIETLGPAQTLLSGLSRYEQAVDVLRYVLARDPIWAIGHDNLIDAFFRLRRYGEAVEAAENARALGLDGNGRFGEALFSVLLDGDPEAALAAFQSLDSDYQQSRLAGSAMALYSLGRQAEADQAFAELRALVEPGRPIVLRAAVHLHVGDLDSAFAILNGLPRFEATFFDSPLFAGIREHPQWHELAKKAGIWPEDPREHIVFEVDIPN